MIDQKASIELKIRKRPWFIWILRAVWLIWVLFWLEATVGSWKEMETRAFVISLIIFLVSLIAGILLWLWGYLRFKKANT